MMRSLVIGLDGSDDDEAALDLGLRWASDYHALAVGVAVIDEPGILNSGDVLFTESYHRPIAAPLLADARRKAGEIERRFVDRARKAGVLYRMLEYRGTPHVQLAEESQGHDLIVLGRRTHFDFGWEDEPDDTLAQVLRSGSRPVVTAPPARGGDGRAVMIAYDGSLQAAHAVFSFEATGLGRSRPVHVVSVGPDRDEAERKAARALEFLRSHDLDARPVPIASHLAPAEVLLDQVERLDAGLLVLGACGRSVLREFFLGSVTRTLLEECPVPVFCDH